MKTKKILKKHNDWVVNFSICGTQKGGTSALDAYLREHPKICMAENKEVHFFDNECFFYAKKTNYSKYHASFNPNISHDLIGEATPIYMYWRTAPKRIWEYNPNMKLIILLRNPIDRAYSHWNMERSRNSETLSFWNALQHEKKRCGEALPHQHRVYSYIDRGFYLKQLQMLWQHFPKDQVLILKSEYLKHQPHAALKDVCNFLKLSHFEKIMPQTVHARPYISKITTKEKEYLKFIFKQEIQNLERTLGWDCSDWRS